MMKHRTTPLALLLAGLLGMVAGCGDSSSPFESPVSHPAAIFPVSPTAFHGPPGSRVTTPEVVVLDPSGKALANIPVTFAVLSGGGFVANRVVATDAAGRATAGHWVLGAEPGENLVIASVEGRVAPVAFMATGRLQPAMAVYGLSTIDNRGVPVDLAVHTILGSYYILYEDGTFGWGSVSGGKGDPIGFSSDVGVFAHTGAVITFEFEGSESSRTARILHGDSLRVTSDMSPGAEVEMYAATPPGSTSGGFPPLTRPGTIYNRQTLHSNPSGALSRYVLHEDGTFGLQYLTATGRFFEYSGRYSSTDSVFTFDFDGWSVAGPWRATGTVRGDSLIVEYNIVMALSDFDDGVYVRAPAEAARPTGSRAIPGESSNRERVQPAPRPAIRK